MEEEKQEESAAFLNDIIRLQLRKPKNWNWQLSTSKSSPHLSLPRIQLYDSKGQLILEAGDCDLKRQSWHYDHFSDRERKIPNQSVNCSQYDDKHKVEKRADKSSASNESYKIRKLQKSESNFSLMPEKLNAGRNPVQHRRTRSDDLFRRKLKHNEMQIIERAQPAIQCNAQTSSSSSATRPTSDNLRYKTRTSSAGTLIIDEQTFSNNNNVQRRQRRRRLDTANNGNYQIENGKRSLEKDKKQSAPITGLFYSMSDVIPFQTSRISAGKKLNSTLDNCDLIEGEKLVKHRKTRTRSSVRHYNSDASSSSSCTKPDNNPTTRRRRRSKKSEQSLSQAAEKARVDPAAPRPRDHPPAQRPRHAAAPAVRMGANVSRHSSKGLNGRRSQSSGSICNGKEARRAPADAKMCGSLPSYLDERDGAADDDAAASCNNNYQEGGKRPLDEVQRIPPLGDGAQLHWKFSDNQTVLCDQGYGSERSPEEEYPPPLPDHDSQCHHHLEPHECYPFITPESTFSVKLTKSSRGLGLSVTGGVDSGGSWPGLIRIKRLFPHQPASSCGLLNVGDLILEANGIQLTGLTNYEALEMLRMAANHVDLRVCRPPPDVLSCVSPILEAPPPPPRRDRPPSLDLPPAAPAPFYFPDDDHYRGEFELTLRKQQGSLGFTLRKEDDSALGHYVRALVREPALKDGRLRAGDRIVAVNEVEISAMSHEEAVQFLRQCGDEVRLRLYRDSAQTPVAALSPTETTPRTSFGRKAHLRQEAVDMLNDIAGRKMAGIGSPPGDRRLHPSEHFHETLLQGPYDDDLSLFTIEPDEEEDGETFNPQPTPVANRKARLNLSIAHNAYELNNLDADVLDAPNLTYTLGEEVESTEVGDVQPASMPHMPMGGGGGGAFSHKSPTYQSAHPPCGCESKRRRSVKRWKGVAFDGEGREATVLPMQEEYEVLAIELNRGWNSRLGFSLQGAAGVTYVSAVHADSVAARDARLRPGDRVIKVNDESVENMSTNEIIDLLRIVRGPVCIVVSRIKTREDCGQCNAEN